MPLRNGLTGVTLFISGLKDVGGLGGGTGLLDGKSAVNLGGGPVLADFVAPGAGPVVTFTGGILGVVIGALLGPGGGGSGDVGVAGALLGAISGATALTGSIAFMDPAAGGAVDTPPDAGLFVYPDNRFASFPKSDVLVIRRHYGITGHHVNVAHTDIVEYTTR